MTHDNQDRIAVNTDGNWRLYTSSLPPMSTVLGTVTRGGIDTGALARIDKTGVYVQINAGVVRSLDGRAVAAALGLIGGPGRGQGRKPLAPDEQTVPVTIRLTESQRDKLSALGGPKWIRAQIDEADQRTAHG